jgi:hypothetical protein
MIKEATNPKSVGKGSVRGKQQLFGLLCCPNSRGNPHFVFF